MSRGNHQEAIYQDDIDRQIFMETLTEVCTRTGWRIHAYVLMGNHYHLLLETPEPNLVMGMKWLQGTYTQRFNAHHREWGHLFQGRYKALLIDNKSNDYFPIVSTYIHLNPARAKLFDLQEGRLYGAVIRFTYEPLSVPHGYTPIECLVAMASGMTARVAPGTVNSCNSVLWK